MIRRIESLTIKAPAKVNLYLNILGKRRDNYHDISSVMERISLFDELKLTPDRKNQIRLFCDVKDLNNERNLAFKAAKLIKDKFQIKTGINLFLKKKIPQGGGLGGASSDAASVLLGLNRLFRLKLSVKKLFLLGALLGSDVNFFLSQSKFAFVTGRGEKVLPLNSSLKLKHILVFTGYPTSTAKIYQAFSLQLTKYIDNAKLIIHCLKNNDRDLLSNLLFNSLTKPYLESSCKARAVFGALSNIEGCSFLLCGSGSTIFALLDRPGLKGRIRKTLQTFKVKTLEVATF